MNITEISPAREKLFVHNPVQREIDMLRRTLLRNIEIEDLLIIFLVLLDFHEVNQIHGKILE